MRRGTVMRTLGSWRVVDAGNKRSGGPWPGAYWGLQGSDNSGRAGEVRELLDLASGRQVVAMSISRPPVEHHGACLDDQL